MGDLYRPGRNLQLILKFHVQRENVLLLICGDVAVPSAQKKKKNHIYYDFSLADKLLNQTVLHPRRNLLEESMPHKSWGLV